jgi:hypothetical protein
MNEKYTKGLIPFLGLGLVAAAGCADRSDTDIGKLKRNVEMYGGMTVTVQGEIDEVRGPNLFKLENDRLFGGSVWVVTTQGTQLQDDQDVAVTGTMQRGVVADIEREYNVVVPDELEIELRDDVVLVADTVTPTE